MFLLQRLQLTLQNQKPSTKGFKYCCKLCKIKTPKVSSIAANSAKLKNPLLKVSSIAGNSAKLKPTFQ